MISVKNGPHEAATEQVPACYTAYCHRQTRHNAQGLVKAASSAPLGWSSMHRTADEPFLLPDSPQIYVKMSKILENCSYIEYNMIEIGI